MKIIAISGATGHVGQAILKELIDKNINCFFNILIHSKKKEKIVKKILKKKQNYKLIYGDLKDDEVIEKLLNNANYFIHLASIIPSISFKNKKLTFKVNEFDLYKIVDYLEKENKECKLIYFSSLAVYGDRGLNHSCARCEDPLFSPPFDLYSLTKIRAEYKILESNLDFIILRLGAVLYKDLFLGNISDSLMFRTVLNTSLEWINDFEIATFISNFFIKELDGKLDNSLFKKCYNLGGGETKRVISHEFYNSGFNLIGRKIDDFFLPHDFASRGFHGVFMMDSNKLNEEFNFWSGTIEDYWKMMKKKNWYFSLGKIVPKFLLNKFIFNKIKNDEYSPLTYINKNNEEMIISLYGSKIDFDNITSSWSNFYQYEYKKELIKYPFDIDKKDEEIDINDLKKYAIFRGGELLETEFKKGDIYKKVKWKNVEGEEFFARPYTLLRCGHFFNKIYYKNEWNYDELVKKDLFLRQVYFDLRKENENLIYYLDDELNEKIKK